MTLTAQPLPFAEPPSSHSSTRHLTRLSSFALITSLQVQQGHELTYSFAQRRVANLPILNSLRTLSIATGVVPPRLILNLIGVLAFGVRTPKIDPDEARSTEPRYNPAAQLYREGS